VEVEEGGEKQTKKKKEGKKDKPSKDEEVREGPP